MSSAKRPFSEYEEALRATLRRSKSDLGVAILVALGMYSSGETDDRSAANFLNLSIPEMGKLQEMIVDEALSFFPEVDGASAAPQLPAPDVPFGAGWGPDWELLGSRFLPQVEMIACPGCGKTIPKDQQICWDCLRDQEGGE